MKKLIIVAVALATIILIGDFLAAPLTGIGWVKSRIGLSLVKNELERDFKAYGHESVKKRCEVPVRKMNFSYDCFLSEGSIIDESGHFETIQLYVTVYHEQSNGALYAKDFLLEQVKTSP